MKQITPEIRARVFALYWGQKVFTFPENDSWMVQKVCVSYMDGYGVKNRALILKPLSSITDEDVRIIDDPRWFTKQNVVTELSRFGGNCWNVFIDQLSPLSYDMLRSKGYALPAFGYSVDELVGAGVFKIKEVNND